MTGPLTTEQLSRIGLASTPEDEHQLLLYINLRLRYLGLPTYPLPSGPVALDQMTSGLIALSREKDRLLSHHLCPVDRRIHDYLDAVLGEGGLAAP